MSATEMLAPTRIGMSTSVFVGGVCSGGVAGGAAAGGGGGCLAAPCASTSPPAVKEAPTTRRASVFLPRRTIRHAPGGKYRRPRQRLSNRLVAHGRANVQGG